MTATLTTYRVRLNRGDGNGIETIYAGLPWGNVRIYMHNRTRLMVVACNESGRPYREPNSNPVNAWPELARTIRDTLHGGVRIGDLISIERVEGGVTADIARRSNESYKAATAAKGEGI
jgi:hypothetical protein